MTDRELLREYARTGSAAAFERLVRAHLDFVYSSAKRRVRDAHLAEDVTQVVFLMLARKAAAVPEGVSVTGWLFRATDFAARDATKMAHRRRRHEREAATMAEARATPDDRWERIAPDLEEALARLSRGERDAVLLRYFRQLSLDDTGAALGISADAAAQRVSRALQKLRSFFGRRGVAVPAATLGSVIAARAVEAAPTGLGASVLGTAGASAGGAAHAAAAERVLQLMGAAKVKLLAACVIAAVAAGTIAAVAPRFLTASRALPAAASAGELTAADLRGRMGPEWEGYPYARGWPLALPGEVTGTPVPADLDGDGDQELLVPCMHSPVHDPDGRTLVHPAPRVERLLFAFHHDGTPLAGWPVVVMDRDTRSAAIRGGGPTEDWNSSPSVMDWDGDRRDEVVILDRAGTVAVEHEDGGPIVVRLANNGDGIGTAPLADINADGVPDLVMGHVLTTVEGKQVRGWPQARRLVGGFAPAVGDANGDGVPELYHPFYVERGTVCGYDNKGNVLPGWPQKVNGQCYFPPVLGDVDGDGLLEVVAAHPNYLSVWRWDGKPLAGTKAVRAFNGVFKEGVSAAGAAPTVVDLDGNGTDEVIVFDTADKCVKAWHGDGRGFGTSDGVVARLPDADCSGGVTVADLGGDGVMDLFVGSHWVQLSENGSVTVTPMVPESVKTSTQCTITDLDRDGSADVAFGLSDGRVFVYRTGQGYRPEWMYWPTQSGNFRHTGTAAAPRPAARRRPALPR